MYNVLSPNRKFKVSPSQITIPEYVSEAGNKLAVDAIIYDGTPHLHVLKLIKAISKTGESTVTNANGTVRQILAHSRFGFGRVIFSTRGAIYADPTALRNILAVVFMDSNSNEKHLIKLAIPVRGPYKGIRPKYRTVMDGELYDAIMNHSETLVKTFSSAANQINPLWLSELTPKQIIAESYRVRSMRDVKDELTEDTVIGDVAKDVNEELPSEAKPEIATKSVKTKSEEKSAKAMPVEAQAKAAGLDLVSSLVNIGSQSNVSPLLELIRQLASGKSLTIKVSLD